MKATFTINGNQIEVECSPEEFITLIDPTFTQLGRKARKPREQPPELISFATLYHEALGMSFLEYVSKDPNKPTDEFIADILVKCTAIRTTNLPTEDRIRTTIEAAKTKLKQPDIGTLADQPEETEV